ncbi:hypothetical protein Enr13x_70790 [Stieleria neptunia]|uniref:Uncharacterized protein n=1 Tax=Stieleria neptunia TaxID=2527979 RepID=A0A518I228_9BACT|nr:hypothetical protein [Stieleria neptunia]QDV47170.1 hypothetical protein Enr13x_70790 [Stieleria neptunia]
MTKNPYSTPLFDASSATADSQAASTKSLSLGSIAKSTFLAWERLRLIFVVVLGLLTLLLAGPDLTKLRTLVLIAEGAIIANVCFFAGPIIETYVRWLGYDRKWVRWFLFVGGTMLTAMLAVATMASIFLPDQN